ncbi:MAG: VanZ family protein [Ilumatobacteraceae bacterium]
MLTDLLLDHKWVTPTILILLVVVGPVAGSHLVDRTSLARVLTAASLLPVAVLTSIPQDRELYSRCELTLNVVWPTPSRVELMANVVLFVAPVLLVAVATGRPAMALLAGTALSFAIEAVQAALPALGRSCDSNDWLTNTMGAVIGAGLGCTALMMARRPT